MSLAKEKSIRICHEYQRFRPPAENYIGLFRAFQVAKCTQNNLLHANKLILVYSYATIKY